MSSINLCDRKGCKSMVRGRALGVVALVTASGPDAERHEREICPGCVADILLVLETPPVSLREPAYNDPYERAKEDDDPLMTGATEEQLAAALLTKLMRGRKELETGD